MWNIVSPSTPMCDRMAFGVACSRAWSNKVDGANWCLYKSRWYRKNSPHEDESPHWYIIMPAVLPSSLQVLRREQQQQQHTCSGPPS